MKKVNILHWVFTGLFGALMLSSAIPNMMSSSEWVAIMTQLGYPLYILPFLGVAKFLGVVAIIVPGFHRLKEWAYAGFAFDLIGAVYSGIAQNGFDPMMLTMLVFFGFGALSYVYYHKKIALQQLKVAVA
jgi:hypothetical protein